MTDHLDRARIRALDGLAPAAREEALAHLTRCGACRERLAGEGGERLFCLLAVDRIPPDALDRLSAAVAAAVAVEEPALPSRRGFAAASLAASLLLAGLLGTYLFTPRVEVGPGTASTPRAERPLVDLARPAPAPAPEGEGLVANGFDVVTPEEAEVVRVQIGDTQLVMVFDEALNL